MTDNGQSNNTLRELIKDVLTESMIDRESGLFYIGYFTNLATQSQDNIEKNFYIGLVDAICKRVNKATNLVALF